MSINKQHNLMEEQTGRPERPDKSMSLKVKDHLKSEMQPKTHTRN